jgi:hypothetical protein
VRGEKRHILDLDVARDLEMAPAAVYDLCRDYDGLLMQGKKMWRRCRGGGSGAFPAHCYSTMWIGPILRWLGWPVNFGSHASYRHWQRGPLPRMSEDAPDQDMEDGLGTANQVREDQLQYSSP